MSLHTLASHLQSAGRGEDKVLVHMTPGEVQGLQSLAMSQGGSLSINPQTGLPEAGILSSLLPMVAGFFLGPAGIGLTAMQSALAVGALGTAATGSLGKGFMMGLGAYGGAGLGSGLVTAGTPAAAPTTSTLAGNTTLSNVGATPNLGTVGGTDTFANLASKTPVNPATGGFNGLQGFNAKSIMAPNAMQNVPSWATTTPVPAPSVVTPTVQTPVFDISKYATPSKSGFTNLGELSPPSIGPTVNATPQIATPSNVVDLSSKGISDLASQTRPINMNMSIPGGQQASNIIEGQMSVPKSPFVDKTTVASPSNFDKARAGFDRATDSWEGAKEVWKATPKGTGYGLAATGMSVLQAQQEEAAEEAKAKADAMAAARRGHYRPYDFSTEQDPNAYANTSTAESIYFVEPRFVARPIEKIAKEGGIMSLAVGGQVEQMSAENAIGSNAMYPQSQLQTPMYSNPMMQRPMPTDVIQSGIDAPTDRYTGEQRFALGGSATAKSKEPTKETKYSYNPETMQYTQTTTTTPASASNSMQDAVRNFYGPVLGGGFGGGKFTGFSKGFGGLGGATINPAFAALYGNQQSAPQPTVTTQTSGGITTQPYTPPTEGIGPINPIAPNINTQPQQNVDRQLGLEAFYPMMEKQLALKGSQLQSQNMASGGLSGGQGGTGMTGGNLMGIGKLKDPEASADLYKNILKNHDQGFVDKLLAKNDWLAKNFLIPAKAQYEQLNAPKAVTGPAVNAFAVPDSVANPQDVNMVPNIQLNQQPQENDPFYQMMQDRLAGYQGYADGGMASGGYNLGGYSDGGRLLRGPGDGVSDSIPASIGNRQPARLADGEFVVPARIVSEIGNGSTEAGARKLYAMMDRVQKARRKTVGKNKVAVNTKADKLLPA
jgi:hypothetical protein